MEAKPHSSSEPKIISMEIIDYQMFHGFMSMSREECRLNGVREFGYGLPPNTMMLAANMSAIANNANLTVHLQFIVKVKSNLGL